MKRLAALLAIVGALALGFCVPPALALDPSAGVTAGTSPSDWFAKQKSQNPNWDVTGKISPAMSQILGQALIDFGSYEPKGDVCKSAAAGAAWQALADAANSGPLEGFLDAIKGALGGIKDVATFGADPSAAADVLSAGQAAQAAFDKAKEMGEDEAKEYLKKRLKEIWTGKAVEVLSRTETRGDCETNLVAIWDEAAGTYEIVIYGGCHCAAVGGWSIGSTGASLNTFAVTLNGSVTAAVSQGKGVYIVGFPKIKVYANCGPCPGKPSRTTGGGTGGLPVTPGATPGGGGVTPGPEHPASPGAWSKVTTTCKECQPIVDQIHAAQAARDGMNDEFRDAKGRYDSAVNWVQTASAGQKAAAQAEFDAAKAAMDVLTARDAGLLKLEEQLWARLKDCEAKCGHASTGGCPAKDGDYALASKPSETAVAAQAKLSQAVLAEINVARANPQAYAAGLRLYAGYYHGKQVDEPGHAPTMTFEGVAAANDAVRFLDAQMPVGPLAWNGGLAGAATTLAGDLGPRGGTGHTGSDGSTMAVRFHRRCIWAAAMEEDISLQPTTAVAIVRQLVIDDGVPTRGHRSALFDPGLTMAGVACGPHAAYGWMCVVDMAGGLMRAPGAEMAPPPPPLPSRP